MLKRDYGAEGKFTFTAHKPGEHQICIHSNSTKWALMAHEKMVSSCKQTNAKDVLENPLGPPGWRHGS